MIAELLKAIARVLLDLPETHRVDETGLVVPALRCEYVCDAFAYVRLLEWGEAVVG